MKKGFTMIELIFVIVILGILAAVAIPRLAATRDDAEIAKAASNAATALSEITSYYTSQGQFGTMAQMSNSVDTSGQVLLKGQPCITFTATGQTVTVALNGCSGLATQVQNALPANFIGTHNVGGSNVSFTGPTTTGGSNP